MSNSITPLKCSTRSRMPSIPKCPSVVLPTGNIGLEPRGYNSFLVSVVVCAFVFVLCRSDRSERFKLVMLIAIYVFHSLFYRSLQIAAENITQGLPFLIGASSRQFWMYSGVAFLQTWFMLIWSRSKNSSPSETHLPKVSLG